MSGVGPKYEQVLYPTGGGNANTSPDIDGTITVGAGLTVTGAVSLNGGNVTLGNNTLTLNAGQLVTGTSMGNGANDAALAANSANNATDGLPGNLTQAGWVKFSATIGNNVTSCFMPFWQTDPS